VFADGSPTPSLTLILQGAGWIALANAVVATVTVGVGSLTGSRALTITGVIGWQAIVTNLLLNISSLGSVREGLLTAALNQLMPVTSDRTTVVLTTGVAIVVLCGWVIVPLLARGLENPDHGCLAWLASACGAGEQRGLAAQRLARGAFDLHGDELARGTQAAEVDDLVVARAAP
jgi:hypothetical protein